MFCNNYGDVTFWKMSFVRESDLMLLTLPVVNLQWLPRKWLFSLLALKYNVCKFTLSCIGIKTCYGARNVVLHLFWDLKAWIVWFQKKPISPSPPSINSNNSSILFFKNFCFCHPHPLGISINLRIQWIFSGGAHSRN